MGERAVGGPSSIGFTSVLIGLALYRSEVHTTEIRWLISAAIVSFAGSAINLQPKHLGSLGSTGRRGPPRTAVSLPPRSDGPPRGDRFPRLWGIYFTPTAAHRWAMAAYQFECPHCQEETLVDAGARQLLIEDGCITCGRSVSASAFEASAQSDRI
jgi:hypothetical protein